MRIKTILTIAKKEFFDFLNSPLSYITIVPFLLISTFIYLRTILVAGEASLRPYFELLPWFLILLAPALTMRLFTEEKKEGTLELLFAHPTSETEIVLGKFLGVFTFFLLILFSTLGLPASLLLSANPDPGVIAAEYIGVIFAGAVFFSLGILSSSLMENTIGSFLLSAFLSFLFILIGLEFIALMLPWPFSRIIEEVAFLPHMDNIARGLLDLRDIFYFLTLSGFFLAATVINLSARKWTEDKTEKRKLRIALILVLAIGLTLNITLSFRPLRLDLTEQKLFTLSEGSKQTIKNLPDTVSVTLFASRNLPAVLQLTLKETEDLLGDYRRMNRKIAIKKLQPDIDSEAAGEARTAGIEEVTFNRIGAGKFEIQSGFLGILIRFGEKTETIPFVGETSSLEYQLTKKIRKLVGQKEKTVGIYKNSFSGYEFLEELVKIQYKTTDLDATALSDKNKRKEIDSLIIIDDGNLEGTNSAIFKEYLEEKGKVLVLANGVSINPQFLSASKSRSGLLNFLSDYGIRIKNDLVFDLSLNEILTFGGKEQIRYAVPYSFWLRALPGENFFPLSQIKSVTLGWPSSIEITKKEGLVYKTILTTNLSAGRQEENFNISPLESNKLPSPLKEKIPLAVLIEKGNTQLIVAGNSNFASDQFLQGFPENATFLTGVIDFLLTDKDLTAVPRKTATRALFRFKKPTDVYLFQYGNILIPPAIIAVSAFYRMARRKRLTRRTYGR